MARLRQGVLSGYFGFQLDRLAVDDEPAEALMVDRLRILL
jgi:hypothetical protein